MTDKCPKKFKLRINIREKFKRRKLAREIRKLEKISDFFLEYTGICFKKNDCWFISFREQQRPIIQQQKNYRFTAIKAVNLDQAPALNFRILLNHPARRMTLNAQITKIKNLLLDDIHDSQEFPGKT